MTVTAIMPTYNQAEFIEEALTSAVYPTKTLNLLCIVNDSSTDDTEAVVGRWLASNNTEHWDHAKLRLSKNSGTATAINAGFKEAGKWMDQWAGDCLATLWMSWVSSDNIYEAGWGMNLESKTRDDTGAIYSAFWRGNKDNVRFTPYDPNRLISSTKCYFGPCFLIREDVWKEAGPHRGKISHDYDHWLRVEEVCWKRGLKILAHPEPLCLYRVHNKRVTVTRRHEFDADHWQAEAKKRRGLA